MQKVTSRHTKHNKQQSRRRCFAVININIPFYYLRSKSYRIDIITRRSTEEKICRSPRWRLRIWITSFVCRRLSPSTLLPTTFSYRRGENFLFGWKIFHLIVNQLFPDNYCQITAKDGKDDDEYQHFHRKLQFFTENLSSFIPNIIYRAPKNKSSLLVAFSDLRKAFFYPSLPFSIS